MPGNCTSSHAHHPPAVCGILRDSPNGGRSFAGPRGEGSTSRIWTRFTSMIQTSARLLQLLSLLQVRREWTGPALADRMGVTERTVRRDIDKLRNLGYPIHASPGIAGGYQLGAGAQLPPLLLDDNEALAVALGLNSVAAGPVAGIGEASVR